MRIYSLRLITGALVAAAAFVGAGAFVAVAPDMQVAEPSGWRDRPADHSVWVAEVAQTGVTVRAAVTDLGMALGLSDMPNVMIFVNAKSTNLSRPQAEALTSMLEAGGSVWISDGSGTFNPWLTGYGLGITRERVLDARASNVTDVGLDFRLDEGQPLQLKSERPATLVFDDESGWRPWLTASAATHLDVDGNRSIDRADPPGPFVIGAMLEHPSGGFLVVSASPGMIANLDSIGEGSPSQQAAVAVVRHVLHSGGTVVLDETPYQNQRPESPWSLAVRVARGAGTASIPLQFVLTALGLVVVALAPIVIPRARAFGVHQARVGVARPRTSQVQHDGFWEQMAWEVLAERRGETAERLRAAAQEKGLRSIASDHPDVLRFLNDPTDSEAQAVFMKRFTSMNGRHDKRRGGKNA